MVLFYLFIKYYAVLKEIYISRKPSCIIRKLNCISRKSICRGRKFNCMSRKLIFKNMKKDSWAGNRVSDL